MRPNPLMPTLRAMPCALLRLAFDRLSRGFAAEIQAKRARRLGGACAVVNRLAVFPWKPRAPGWPAGGDLELVLLARPDQTKVADPEAIDKDELPAQVVRHLITREQLRPQIVVDPDFEGPRVFGLDVPVAAQLARGLPVELAHRGSKVIPLHGNDLPAELVGL